MLSHCILFVGYSLSEQNIRYLVEIVLMEVGMSAGWILDWIGLIRYDCAIRGDGVAQAQCYGNRVREGERICQHPRIRRDSRFAAVSRQFRMEPRA